ncbi:hypothetical protein BJX96DRAFT_115241 [Aspergillus floccosus]
MKPALSHCNVRGPLRMSSGVVGAWFFPQWVGVRGQQPLHQRHRGETPQNCNIRGIWASAGETLVVLIRGGRRSQFGTPVVPGPTLKAWVWTPNTLEQMVVLRKRYNYQSVIRMDCISLWSPSWQCSV